MPLFRRRESHGAETRAKSAALQTDDLGRPRSLDPELVTKALFDSVLPAVGVADSKAVEEQFLGWQDSRTVYRGRRAEVEPLVLMDLRHMASEPGFKNFTIETKTVEPQKAAEVVCFMGEESRAGYLVGVPVRVWCTGDRYVISGIDESWKTPTTEPASDVELAEEALSDAYSVTVHYDLSLADAIAAGSFDEIADEYVGQSWTEWQAPDGSPLGAPTGGSAERQVLLFHVGGQFGEGPYPTTKKVLGALASAGLVAEGIRELLALGRAYPDLQREFPVYELGVVWVRPSREPLVSGLVAQYRLRRLGLSSFDNLWPPEMRILVSRA